MGKIFIRVVFVVLLFVGTAFADRPSNYKIVDATSSYSEGSYGNTCKIFVQNVLAKVKITLGAGYRDSYLNIGVEIPANEVQPGDIIQTSNDADGENFYTGCHSAIVLGNNNNGTFSVIHSNWCQNNCNLIYRTLNYDPYAYANENTNENKTISVHFYRVGTIAGYYSDGFRDNGISKLFLDAFNQYKSVLSHVYARDYNGGGVFVHEYNSTDDQSYSVWIQDFYNPTTDKWYALVLNDLEEKPQVFLLQGAIRNFYMNDDGPGKYGVPFTDEIAGKLADSHLTDDDDLIKPSSYYCSNCSNDPKDIVVQKFWLRKDGVKYSTNDDIGRRTIVHDPDNGNTVHMPVGEFAIHPDQEFYGNYPLVGEKVYFLNPDDVVAPATWPDSDIEYPWPVKDDGDYNNFVPTSCDINYNNIRWFTKAGTYLIHVYDYFENIMVYNIIHQIVEGNYQFIGAPVVNNPANLTAVPISTTQIKLIMTLPENASDYDQTTIEMDGEHLVTVHVVDEVNIVGGLSANTSHCFQVKLGKYGTEIESEPSEEACATTLVSNASYPLTVRDAVMCSNVDSNNDPLDTKGSFVRGQDDIYFNAIVESQNSDLEFKNIWINPDGSQRVGIYHFRDIDYDASAGEYKTTYMIGSSGIQNGFGLCKLQLWTVRDEVTEFLTVPVLDSMIHEESFILTPGRAARPTVEVVSHEETVVHSYFSGDIETAVIVRNDNEIGRVYAEDFTDQNWEFIDTTVEANTQYIYKIVEQDAESGYYSPSSETYTITTPELPEIHVEAESCGLSGATEFELATDGLTTGWTDDNSGLIENIFDTERASNVIHLQGINGATCFTLDDNGSYFNLSGSPWIVFNVKTDKYLKMRVKIITTAGDYRHIELSSDKHYVDLGSGYYRYPVGHHVVDSKWHFVAVNIQEILDYFEPGAELAEILKFFVYTDSNVYLDNMMAGTDYDRTVYAYGLNPDLTTTGWITNSTNTNYGAEIVYDTYHGSDVINLVGDNATRFTFRNPDSSDWNVSGKYIAEMSFATNTANKIQFDVNVDNAGTTERRFLEYRLADGTDYLSDIYSIHFLGWDYYVNTGWKSIELDLEADLAEFEPDVTLINVTKMYIWKPMKCERISLERRN